MQSQSSKSFFTRQLMQWSKTHCREMPWKGEKDPYKIWLSEVILQQTRVSQGLPYYLKFVDKYPDVFALANAPEDEVLKLWQGLGYYTRARNLHHSAKIVANEMDGKFPSTYDEIIQLKGVGPYSAAAIASFAFDEPQAVVDGNVMRVLARYFGITDAVDSGRGKKKIKQLASEVIDRKAPGRFNQAIMDFGAAVCLPANPLCAHCPLQEKCRAYQKGIQQKVPIKEKKIRKKNRYFTYLVIYRNNKVFLRKRQDKDIWKGLFEFPLIESSRLLPPDKLVAHPAWNTITEGLQPTISGISTVYKHTLTHQNLRAIFVEVNVKKDLNSPFIPTSHKNLDKFAFPKLIEKYLTNNFLYLTKPQ